MLRFGIRADLLARSARSAIPRAARLGFGAVQLVASGELHPDELSLTGRRDLQHYITSHGLSLSAWLYPMRHGLTVEDGLEERLEELRKTLAMAYQTRTPYVVTSIGRVPSDPDHPARQLLREVLLDLAEYADRVGATLAIETGTEPGEVLATFLDELDRGTLQVNYDPAALRVKGYDPLKAFESLAERVVHCHAWDTAIDPATETGQVVPPGSGIVPWPDVLRYLKEADYRGWIVIDQLHEASPAAAEAALQYFRSLG